MSVIIDGKEYDEKETKLVKKRHQEQTPEAPKGIYHYHSTSKNGDGLIGFPYFLLSSSIFPFRLNSSQSSSSQSTMGAPL